MNKCMWDSQKAKKEQLCDYFDRIYENMERLKNAAMEGQNETV